LTFPFKEKIVLKQKFKITTESKQEVAKKEEREAKESGQRWGRRRNIASQGLKKEYEIILNNAVRQS